MANIALTFTNEINVSAQVGDTAYYCATTSTDSFDTSYARDNTVNDNLFEIGLISDIDASTNTITCYQPKVTSTTKPPSGSFILFSKDNRVNMASPLGYYALVKFKNDSSVKGEMFSAACEIFDSSK